MKRRFLFDVSGRLEDDYQTERQIQQAVKDYWSIRHRRRYLNYLCRKYVGIWLAEFVTTPRLFNVRRALWVLREKNVAESVVRTTIEGPNVGREWKRVPGSEWTLLMDNSLK